MTASTEIEYRDIRLDVPWGHIAGRWYGNRKTRPILALHGWMDNIGTWEKLIPLLPKHIGFLCVDFPGHGHSSRLPAGMTYYAFDFARVIIRVMKEYNWQKVSLMGHSLGAITALLFTSFYSQKVDLFIAIDFIYPRYDLTPKRHLDLLRENIEKNMLWNERNELFAFEEPPSHTYAKLEQLLHRGSGRSVELENCKYILDRSIAKSVKYPKKFYFSRDGKLKYYTKFRETSGFFNELTKNIKNLPYLIVKASQSPLTEPKYFEEFLETMRENNPHFEFHQIDGTHHVHLNNAAEVAAVITPFINRHRPAALDRWSLNGDGVNGAQLESPSQVVNKKAVGKVRSKL